jgi:hypothetical protein
MKQTIKARTRPIMTNTQQSHLVVKKKLNGIVVDGDLLCAKDRGLRYTRENVV